MRQARRLHEVVDLPPQLAVAIKKFGDAVRAVKNVIGERARRLQRCGRNLAGRRFKQTCEMAAFA